MLFFDLDILEEGTRCDPQYLVTALYKFWRGQRFPKNAYEKHKPLARLRPGSAFLLNPKPLFDDRSTDYTYKAQYIRLAGRRNFANYKTHGTKSLDLTLYPDLDLKAIQSNPLLQLANKQINFLYER